MSNRWRYWTEGNHTTWWRF